MSTRSNWQCYSCNYMNDLSKSGILVQCNNGCNTLICQKCLCNQIYSNNKLVPGHDPLCGTKFQKKNARKY